MKVVRTEEFESLREQWNDLQRSPVVNSSVYSTWDWLSTWWKHYGGRKKPIILSVEDEGRILAIAPFMSCTYKLLGLTKVVKLELIGGDISEYRDILISDRDTESLGKIVRYLKNNVEGWNWVEMRDVSETSAISRFAGTAPALRPDIVVKSRLTHRCPYIALPESHDQLIKTRSHNFRKNLRKGTNQLSKNHILELKRYDELGFSPAKTLDLFIDLHERRWAAKESGGLFTTTDKRYRDFHREICQIFDGKGWLGTYFLTLDGEPIGAMHGYEYAQKYHAYLLGLDPEYARYSVGNLLVLFLAERLIGRGFRELDFARGDEDWKFQWTDAFRKNLEIRFVYNAPFSRSFDFLTWNPNAIMIGMKLGITLRRESCMDPRGYLKEDEKSIQASRTR